MVVLNTQAKTANLTIPTLQTSPAQQKIPQKIDFLLYLEGALTTYPYKLRQNIFARPGGVPAPRAPPGHANVQRTR